VFFAWHVFWPQGFEGTFDWVTALIGISALLTLFRYKAGIIPVIMISGLAGLLLMFVKPWLAQQGLL
jgi:chromate transporter